MPASICWPRNQRSSMLKKMCRNPKWMKPEVTTRSHCPATTAGLKRPQRASKEETVLDPERPPSDPPLARSMANTSTLRPIRILVTSIGSPVAERTARRACSDRGGCPAFRHSQQCAPTAASCRHSQHAGRPQRVQRRPVSRSVWKKHVVRSSVGGGSGNVIAEARYRRDEVSLLKVRSWGGRGRGVGSCATHRANRAERAGGRRTRHAGRHQPDGRAHQPHSG